jgi:hypothetical protein
MMQRIAASVDGKTGRLKVHLSKKYKHNLRGTKFSMPKAGSVRVVYFVLIVSFEEHWYIHSFLCFCVSLLQ